VNDRTRTPLRTWALGAWSVLALVYLFIPIGVVILYSFNDPQGRFNLTWEGFTLDHWKDPFAVDGLGEALSNSLLIGALSTAVAVVLGTFMALALVRYRFTGRAPTNFFIFLPLATPEVVLGAALLGLFITLGVATGFLTIFIAHTMFIVCYVVVTIRARLYGLDTHLEEAAMDLGANEWAAFRKVTLPLIAPGVAAAALLGFALSVDDFVITNFTAGQTSTFPLFIWGAARQGVPAEVNVLATGLLLAVLVLMALNVAYQRRRARAEAGLVVTERTGVTPGLAREPA
jgi:spermidine/putrescine transport system permease protein